MTIYRRQTHYAHPTSADINDWRQMAVDALKPGPLTLRRLAEVTGEGMQATTLRLRRFPRYFDFPTRGGTINPEQIVDLAEGLRFHNPVTRTP